MVGFKVSASCGLIAALQDIQMLAQYATDRKDTVHDVNY